MVPSRPLLILAAMVALSRLTAPAPALEVRPAARAIERRPGPCPGGAAGELHDTCAP
jgi:hypothetical protein